MTNEEMHSKISVSLSFHDFSEKPEDLTSLLGIAPSKVLRAGEPRKHGQGKVSGNLWQIDSGLDQSASLEQHVKALLGRIQPHFDKFESTSKRYPPELSCVVYSYNGDRPALPFSREVIETLSRLNAEIDIDLYVL